MKFLLIPAILLLVPALAPASGTSIGNGRSCREGAIETFNESRGEGEPSSQVSFVCRSGHLESAAPAEAKPAPRGCVEGSHEHWTTESAQGLVNGDYVCRGGRYVPVRAD